jgi:hypothetical protein
VLSTLDWRMRSITPFSFLRFFMSFFSPNQPSFLLALKCRASQTLFRAQNGSHLHKIFFFVYIPTKDKCFKKILMEVNMISYRTHLEILQRRRCWSSNRHWSVGPRCSLLLMSSFQCIFQLLNQPSQLANM